MASLSFFFETAAACFEISHLAINARRLGHLLQQSEDRAVPGSITLCPVFTSSWSARIFRACALGEVGEARVSLHGSMLAERGGPEAALSTVRGDSQVDSPSGMPTTPAMPSPREVIVGSLPGRGQ